MLENTLTLYKVGKDRLIAGEQPSEVILDSEQPFTLGKEFKRKIKAILIGKYSERSVHFVERGIIDDPDDLEITADELIEKHSLAKNAGLPVVNTIRKTNRDTIFVTDVTADGSQTYGKSSFLGSSRKYRGGHELDLTFQEIVASSLIEIKKEGYRLAELAAENGLRLPFDDPMELIIHQDGTWNLIILDLTHLSSSVKNKSEQELFFENKKLVNRFVIDLERLRDEMENGNFF